MGQYHTIYNVTKKEYFSIGGAKLLEKAFNPLCSAALMVLLCNSNGRGGGDLCVEREYTNDFKPKPLKGEKKEIQDALDLIQGRWAGDSIVIQGDYAEATDPAYVDESKNFTNITDLLFVALCADRELSLQVQEEVKFRQRMGKL